MNTKTLEAIAVVYDHASKADKDFFRDNYARIMDYTIEPFDNDSSVCSFKGYYDNILNH